MRIISIYESGESGISLSYKYYLIICAETMHYLAALILSTFLYEQHNQSWQVLAISFKTNRNVEGYKVCKFDGYFLQNLTKICDNSQTSPLNLRVQYYTFDWWYILNAYEDPKNWELTWLANLMIFSRLGISIF